LDSSTWHAELHRDFELPFAPYVGLSLQLSPVHPVLDRVAEWNSRSGLKVNPLLRLQSVHYQLEEGIFQLGAMQYQADPSHLRDSLEQWVTEYGFLEAMEHRGGALVHMAGKGDVEGLRAWLNRYRDVVALDGWAGGLALQCAARNNHLAVLQLLLEAGVPPGEAETGASPALIEAAGKGHLELMRVLLALGAAVNARAREGRTALTTACFTGQLEAVELLLQLGADPNLRGLYDSTPLARAATMGHTEVVRLLLRVGASPVIPNKAGETPLALALRRGHRETAALLQRADSRSF
jgi:ankyrin repeat protein